MSPSGIEFACRATIIGGMPHKDAASACALLGRHLADIPAWPQLPNRSFLEDMCVQFSEGFPGARVEGVRQERDPHNERFYVSRVPDRRLDEVSLAFKTGRIHEYDISKPYADGLHEFLSSSFASSMAAKGQVTGPVSFGIVVSTADGRPIVFDGRLSDAVAELLALKARWQEAQLRQVNKHTVIFVNEPALAASGLVAPTLSWDRARALISTVFAGITGLKGIHCCGDVDWAELLLTEADIVSFDAYNYAHSLMRIPDRVRAYLENGGTIAWGIVPVFADQLAGESISSLKDRLEETVAPFTRHDIPFRQILKQSLLTPACGLQTLDVETSGRALELLAGLSEMMRKRYL